MARCSAIESSVPSTNGGRFMPEIAKCNIATTKLLGISTRASDFQESLLSGKNIKTCKINFDYKAKLTGNRLSTPFFIDSKYSSGAESGPTAETSSHLTAPSSGESTNFRFREMAPVAVAKIASAAGTARPSTRTPARG